MHNRNVWMYNYFLTRSCPAFVLPELLRLRFVAPVNDVFLFFPNFLALLECLLI